MFLRCCVVSVMFDPQSSRLSDDSRVSRSSRLDLQPVGGTGVLESPTERCVH